MTFIRKPADPTALPLAGALFLLSAVLATPASAQDSPKLKRWAVTVNATEVFVDENAPNITLAGAALPGSNVRIGNATTPTLDVGYFFTPNIAANVFLGVPAPAEIDGTGSIGPLGTLAKVHYGPVILSAQYHFKSQGKLHPYVGVGVGRVLFFNKHDGALSDFNIRDSWAPTGQLGVRYELNKSWMLNADVRYVPFSTHASGSLGGAPALTRLDIDPILTSVGVTLRF